MDPDQTSWMRRLVWIHADRKPIMLVLSWRGSFVPQKLYYFRFSKAFQFWCILKVSKKILIGQLPKPSLSFVISIVKVNKSFVKKPL
jgi:hypothetical protein